MPLSQDVPKLSHEKCLQVLALLHLRDYLRTSLTTLGGLASGLTLLDRFLSSFLEIKIVNVYLRFLTCLHFTTGCNRLLWGSWTFEGYPVRLSLNPFRSACALMLRNQRRILAPLTFSKRVPASPRLRYGGAERGLVLCFELVDISRRVPYFSAGASFLLPSFLVCPILKFWRTWIAFLRFTLLHHSSRRTLSFLNLYVVPCAMCPWRT